MTVEDGEVVAGLAVAGDGSGAGVSLRWAADRPDPHRYRGVRYDRSSHDAITADGTPVWSARPMTSIRWSVRSHRRSSPPASARTITRARNIAERRGCTRSNRRTTCRAELDAEDRGMEIIGVVHSHTHSEAYPSPTDVAAGPRPDLALHDRVA